MTLATEPVKRYIARRPDGSVVGKADLREVPVAAIKLDSAYQRDTSREWLDENGPFDRKKAGAVIASSRAGGPYCIDGGHRVALAKESGVVKVLCFVIDGLTQIDEANLFEEYQTTRRNLTTWTLFRAQIVGGRWEANDLLRIVNASGFHLSRRTGGNDRTITAIDAVRKVYRLGGENLLRETLRAIAGSWLGLEKALAGQTIYGLALFLDSSQGKPAWDPKVMEYVLGHNAPLRIFLVAQSIAEKRRSVSTGPSTFAEALVAEYDKRISDPASKLNGLTIRSRKRPARG